MEPLVDSLRSSHHCTPFNKCDDDDDDGQGSNGDGRRQGALDEGGGDGSPRDKKQDWMGSFIYGLINATLAIPCFYGYASIIFRHQIYAPFM
ncbi:unnamed protein product, partial [Choristocarpus tenellus]